MIILRLGGGQANQMYEFAAAYSLAKVRGEELALDISTYSESARGYQLDYFCIPDLKKILYFCPDADNSLGAAIGIPASFLEHGKVYSDINSSLPAYNDLSEANSLEGDPVILSGYFFDRDRYYKPFWDEIRDFFVPNSPVPFLDQFSRFAEGHETVGVHIRRTDFIVADFAFMPEDDYFRAAISWYRYILSNPRFFIFSDDIEYAKSILGQDSSLFYISNTGHNEAPFVDFLCLSRCRHKILSNDSTFSNLSHELNMDAGKTVMRRRAYRRRSRLKKALKWVTALHPSGNGAERVMDTPAVVRWAKKYRADGVNPIENYAQKIHEAVTSPDHSAVLGKIDELFMNVGELQTEDRKALAYRKFIACTTLKLSDQALDLAYTLWHDFDADPAFYRHYAAILREAGFFMEAGVEEARCQPEATDIFNTVTHHNGKRRFLIVPYLKMRASSASIGLVPLGLVLRRLGHEVTFLFKTGFGEAEDKGESYYIRKNELLTTRCEVCLGCFQLRYEDVVEAQGLKRFLENFCSSDPATIITRDPALCETAHALSFPYIYAGFPKGDPESGMGNKLPPEIRSVMEQQAIFTLPSCRDEEQEYQLYTDRWAFRQEQRAPEYAIRQAAALCSWLATSK